MLVLSRLEGDSISVPDIDLAIRVLKISGGRIRLGIEAPDHVRVLRTETLSSSKKQAASDTQLSSDERRNLSKQISQAKLAIQVAERHFQRGENAQAEAALEQARVARTPDSGRHSSVCEESSGYLVSYPTEDLLRILLIENESNEVNALDELLEVPNIDIQIAGDAVDAISLLNAGEHDLLILEPRADANEITGLVKRIRSDRRFDALPIAIVNLVKPDQMPVNRIFSSVPA